MPLGADDAAAGSPAGRQGESRSTIASAGTNLRMLLQRCTATEMNRHFVNMGRVQNVPATPLQSKACLPLKTSVLIRRLPAGARLLCARWQKSAWARPVVSWIFEQHFFHKSIALVMSRSDHRRETLRKQRSGDIQLRATSHWLCTLWQQLLPCLLQGCGFRFDKNLHLLANKEWQSVGGIEFVNHLQHARVHAFAVTAAE